MNILHRKNIQNTYKIRAIQKYSFIGIRNLAKFTKPQIKLVISTTNSISTSWKNVRKIYKSREPSYKISKIQNHFAFSFFSLFFFLLKSDDFLITYFFRRVVECHEKNHFFSFVKIRYDGCILNTF